MKEKETKSLETSNKKALEGDSTKLGSFVAYLSFIANQDYKLYDMWTLDNTIDIHVYNNGTRSRFTRTREAGPNDKIYARKTLYPIKAFGTVSFEVWIVDGSSEIELKNVALAPGFITNLVSLYLLNVKGVY